MEGAAGQGKARRRSTRIVLRVPLFINVTDAGEQTDWEPVVTLVVSSHGGLIRTRQKFPVGAQLQIRLRDGMREAVGRIVWTNGQSDGQGYEVGFEILDPPGFWGIKFFPDRGSAPPKSKG